MSQTAYETVRTARSNKRPTGLDFIGGLFTDFFELHGDRRFADDPAVVGGVARLNGLPVTVIATSLSAASLEPRENPALPFGRMNVPPSATVIVEPLSTLNELIAENAPASTAAAYGFMYSMNSVRGLISASS